MTLDEFSLIDRYFKHLTPQGDQVTIGPGDDCAVLKIPAGIELCVSTDTLLEGVHFPHAASGDVVAARTLGANLSDLAAMGAQPHSVVLAITLPELNHTWLEAFSGNLKILLERYKVPLTGGNISRGKLSLTMTVMGCVPAGSAITRAGARPGDLVFVTGTLGDAGAGLSQLTSRDTSTYLVARYESPTPRVEIGMALRGFATAMVDISDGLLADSTHIARASQCELQLSLDSLPLSEPLLAHTGFEAAQRLALTAGDDYELCFTCPAEQHSDVIAIASECDVPVTHIGHVSTGSGVNVLDRDGNPVSFPASGYQHF